MVKNLQIYILNIWNSIIFVIWNFTYLINLRYYKNTRIIFWREQINDLKAESRDVKSLPNCHCSDATRIKLPEYFTCCFMLCICLITSQFCEGGIHFISQWLVSVLIDTKFVWGERKNLKIFQYSVSKAWRCRMDQQTFL